MQVLFLENEDSFSWNLIDRLPCRRDEVRVLPGADVASFRRLLPESDVLVIGPGPRDPLRCPHLVDAVRLACDHRVPTLGVCLGHQAIGLAFGARLTRSTPTHGKRSAVTFDASHVVPGIAGEHEVMRYHSLSLQDVRTPLRVIARTGDGEIMAVEHETLPVVGLQFHPDSFASPTGARMLSSFFGGLP